MNITFATDYWKKSHVLEKKKSHADFQSSYIVTNSAGESYFSK